MELALRVFTFHHITLLLSFPPFLKPYLQRPGERLMNYFSVIRPPAGQITHHSRVPSSMVLIGCGQLLTVGLCRLHAGFLSKRYRTPWTPLGLRKAGQIYYPLRSSCVALGTSLCGRLCRGKEVGETSQWSTHI
ncbi:hypothetical protein AVEN_42955-1 [Araneus ventricosus]|uniref:Uncharacterized protein n=1 Tax=Araneus ventricosus TaxID=182803 RepID=A0A4Y2AFU4_ARAVE|nr:hypothetical protein AVEN_42955-1 [Araneus ventricosus]